MDREIIKKDRQEAKQGQTDIFWVPTQGKHRLRILDQDPVFYVKRKFHYLDISGQRRPVMCASDNCPVCQIASKLAKQGDRQSAKTLMPKNRYFCNIVPLLEHPLRVRIWGFGPMVFDELAAYAEDPEWGDAVVKKDIILEREGEGIDTSYKVRISQKATPIPKEVLVDVPDLESILVPRDRDYITGLLSESEFGSELGEYDEYELKKCFGLYDTSDPDCKACHMARSCAKDTASKK